MLALTDLDVIKNVLKEAETAKQSKTKSKTKAKTEPKDKLSINLRDLLILVGCHQLMQMNPEEFLSEDDLRKLLGLTQGTLRGALEAFEAAASVPLWEKDNRGRRSRQGHHVDAQLRNFDNLISNLACLFDKNFHIPQIGVGVSPELIRWIAPEVIRRYRELHPDKRFQVEIIHRMPGELSELADSGKLDLVVCSQGRDAVENTSGRSHVAELPLHLLIDRRHPLVVKYQGIQWSDLGGMTLVLLKGRADEIRLSLGKHLPKTTRITEVDTYAEAYAMILASGGKEGLCCAGFPQIMSPERRARFAAFRPSGMPTIRFCIQRSKMAEEQKHSSKHDDIIDGLFEAFRETMNAAGRGVVEGDDFARILSPTMRTTWHISTTRKGDRIWLQGCISNLVITSDGYLRADHEVTTETGTVTFTISGHATRVDQQLHIVWRGWQRMKNPSVGYQGFNIPPEESYAVSLTGKHDVGRGLIGHWLGRRFGQKYHPDFGYFVLVENGTPEPSNNDLVEFESQHGKLTSDFPTKMRSNSTTDRNNRQSIKKTSSRRK